MTYNPRQFVDREPQLDAFQTCLHDREKSHVLLFHGPQGMGKTSMLYWLRAACRESQTACVLVDFEHGGLNIPEALIHHLRQQIGGDFFDAIGRELVALQQDFPKQASLLQGLSAWAGGSLLPAGQPQPAGMSKPAVSVEAQIGNVGDENMIAVGTRIAMNKITINNSQIYTAPEKEDSFIQEEKLRRLSRAFRDALERLVSNDRLVLLFDACDSATTEVIRWLREQLLDLLLDADQPSMANLFIVLVGDPHCERGTWLDKIISWGQGVTALELGYLPPEAVLKYWIDIRHVGETKLPPDFRTRGAPPFLMVWMADYYSEA